LLAVLGYVRGYSRRFWQISEDHRGTSAAPGRVVTLIQNEESITWGCAYRLPQSMADDILKQIDYREKGGYTQAREDVYVDDSCVIKGAVIYVPAPYCNEFVGPANAILPDGEDDLSRIAHQIAFAEGPSGSNADYLLKLAEALRDLGAIDVHVFELEKRVLHILQEVGDLSPKYTDAIGTQRSPT